MMSSFVANNLRPTLENKKILLGITGSIAAFKACDLIRHLRDCGARVRVVPTRSALEFVTPLTLETLTGEPVVTSLWRNEGMSQSSLGTHHIEASRWADIALVAPATANIIASLAHGFANDLLTTELLAFRNQVLVAPAMNPAMWSNAATQANVKTLQSRGIRVLGPTVGMTSCGEQGLGRMLEPENLLEEIARCFYSPKKGKRLLITLGPTRSYLDPVRYLTNRSSGLMGASLCWAAASEGFEITAVCGPTDAPLPKGIEVVRVTTATEMEQEVVKRWPTYDIYVGAAAVLDWDFKTTSTEKIKKDSGPPNIELKKNSDILGLVSSTKREDQFVLGFAAETQDPTHHGLLKLITKGCDAVFANDVSRQDTGFESEQNAGWWIDEEVFEIPVSSKAQIARKILSNVEVGLAGKSM